MARKGIMLCTHYEERRLTNPKFGWTKGFYIQPKYDGHRAVAVRNELGEYILRTSEGIEYDLPHITVNLRNLGKVFPYSFDGEIYTHGLPLEKISSLLKGGSPEQQRVLDYYIFDLYTPDLTRTFEYRYFRVCEKAAGTLNFFHAIHFAPTVYGTTLEMLEYWLDFYMSEQYEGIVIKHPDLRYTLGKNGAAHRSVHQLKLKPKQMDCYPIVDVFQAYSDGKPMGIIGGFIVGNPEEETFRISAGRFTNQERKELWETRENLTGKYLTFLFHARTQKNDFREAFGLRISDEDRSLPHDIFRI